MFVLRLIYSFNAQNWTRTVRPFGFIIGDQTKLKLILLGNSKVI